MALVQTEFIVETQTVTFSSLPLDCGVTLMNVDVAYETYGKLNADRSNAILVLARVFGRCTCGRGEPGDGTAGLVGGDDRARAGIRYREVLCYFVERAGGLSRNDRAGLHRSGDRGAVCDAFPGDYDRRHGAFAEDAGGLARDRTAIGSSGRLDGRHAGAGSGRWLIRRRWQRRFR